MIREQAIIQSISISKKGQRNFFQVKLPRDAHKIIGIETGLYVLNAPGYFIPVKELTKLVRRNNLVGRIQLRANGKPDVFYSKEVFERDINIGVDEIKIITPPIIKEKKGDPSYGNSFDYFTHWIHGTKREEDPLDVCGCTVINGQYKDTIGENFETDVHYKVMLYIWVERKTNQQ